MLTGAPSFLLIRHRSSPASGFRVLAGWIGELVGAVRLLDELPPPVVAYTISLLALQRPCRSRPDLRTRYVRPWSGSDQVKDLGRRADVTEGPVDHMQGGVVVLIPHRSGSVCDQNDSQAPSAGVTDGRLHTDFGDDQRADAAFRERFGC